MGQHVVVGGAPVGCSMPRPSSCDQRRARQNYRDGARQCISSIQIILGARQRHTIKEISKTLSDFLRLFKNEGSVETPPVTNGAARWLVRFHRGPSDISSRPGSVSPSSIRTVAWADGTKRDQHWESIVWNQAEEPGRVLENRRETMREYLVPQGARPSPRALIYSCLRSAAPDPSPAARGF